jgi:hypothetical protein
MRTLGSMHAGTALGFVGLIAAGALAAQNPPAAAPPSAPPPWGAQAVAGGTAQYLVENPAVLHLTPVQVERLRKVAAKVDGLNAPVRARIQQLTGGRPFRELPPPERRRIAPQVQQATQQLRANNEMALDSIEAVLTPEQTSQLENLRVEYKERLQARRAARPAAPPRRRP